jgi:hypothetical protein
MALHRDIFWIGRQWAVTGIGMQVINQKLDGKFDVGIDRLWDDDWLAFLREQNWFNAEDFAKGMAIARARYPEPPRQSLPPLPVEALLRTSATVAPPIEAMPSLEPVASELLQPAKPVPSFMQMSLAGHPAKLLRPWRVKRRPIV